MVCSNAAYVVLSGGDCGVFGGGSTTVVPVTHFSSDSFTYIVGITHFIALL